MTKTIVVGLDGSSASRASFHRAIEEAVYREAEVLAVHIYSYPIMTGYEIAFAVDYEAAEQGAQEWVAKEITRLDAEYEVDFPVPVRTEVMCGHAGGKLIEAARGAEMIVLGSRGYGGFRGLLLGSVTTYVVHHLPCALLVVPAPDETDDTDKTE